MLPNDIKIRCSSLGYIMTDPREKAKKESGELSETCKGHLSDIMVRAKYGRQTDVQNRYTIKGNQVEEDSITLYSRVTKKFYRKNDRQISNGYISGTPDIYQGKSIEEATHIIDIKSSWDIFTFFRNHEAKLNQQYFYQLQGYMWLTGAESSTLAYCLVNTPDALIEDEKRRLFYKMNVATVDNEQYQQACDEIEKNMRYDDIPLSERVIEIEVQRDNEVIKQIEQKVIACRKYMSEKYASLFTSVLIDHHDAEANATIIEPINLSLLKKITNDN